MIKILLLLLLICSNAFAEIYSIERPDGTVAIQHSWKTSEECKEDRSVAGYGTFPAKKIDASALPNINGKKTDRDYWTVSGSRIVIDAVKKQDDLEAIAQKEAEEDALMEKLKINRQEADILGKI
jgi:hypothetical protein